MKKLMADQTQPSLVVFGPSKSPSTGEHQCRLIMLKSATGFSNDIQKEVLPIRNVPPKLLLFRNDFRDITCRFRRIPKSIPANIDENMLDFAHLE